MTDAGSRSVCADDVSLAADLVGTAGRLAHRMHRDGVRAVEKTSRSDIVTDADHAAEQLIVDRLRELRPKDSILGEEGATHTGSSGRAWVIDPIDGTYNYAAGLTWWCSALALRDETDVLLGAVYHPHDDVIYLGGPQHPCTRNGEPLARLTDKPLAECCATTYLHPPHYGDAVGEAFGRAVNAAATVRMLGSGTLDQMALAQGQTGVLFQHSVADWDWLPGSAIVRGVGGAARKVTAAGVEWSVAGAPSAVAEVAQRLRNARPSPGEFGVP